MLIQILDDSDDPITQTLIKEEVDKWEREGARIVYRHRVIRDGYKAGNLKSAMSCNYVRDYEFVAIFDADFQPNPDFLMRTVPHFKVLILGLKLATTLSYIMKILCFFIRRVNRLIFLHPGYYYNRIMRTWVWFRQGGPL